MAQKHFFVDANGNGNRLENWILSNTCDITELTGVKSIDSFQLTGTTLILHFTKFDNSIDNVSIDLSAFAVNVNVQGVAFTNPSAGVWNLTVTETDGSTHTVNLASLLAVVVSSNSEVALSGDGTPANPLSASIVNIAGVKIIYDNSVVGILTSTDIQGAVDELALMISNVQVKEKWVSYRIPSSALTPGTQIILTTPFDMADFASFQISIKDCQELKGSQGSLIPEFGWEIEGRVSLVSINQISVELNNNPAGNLLCIDVNYMTEMVVGSWSKR